LTPQVLRIGTRGSPLALFQARAVAALLRDGSSMDAEIVVIRTSGDQEAHAALSPIGGKRLFVKEIEDALLAGEIDMAVHSSKDMSANLPKGLTIGAVLPRADARDALVLRRDLMRDEPASIETVGERLGSAPRIGTSSVRRSAQLARLWPRATFAPVRGNLDTRLRKLDAGDGDALVLASAGLNRLEHSQRISLLLPVEACVPAPGQGIIAVEIRGGDAAVAALVTPINDHAAFAALAAERAVVTRLGGGCQMPIGAFAAVSGRAMSMHAVVIAPDGTRAVRAEAQGDTDDPGQLGTGVAERLLAEGADAILAEVRQSQASTGVGKR
jgi:hydroxymethylbilane synthase